MKAIIFITAIVMLAIACNNKNAAVSESQIALIDTAAFSGNYQEEKNKSDSVPGNIIPPKNFHPGGTSVITPTDLDKKIIKTANLRLELQHFDAFNAGIHQLVKRYNGYIASENQENTDYRVQIYMTIKVPANRFEELVNSFGGEGIRLEEKNISSEDVTGQFIDTKSRMEAKKQVRARYIELLHDAKKMSDVLAVQSEINTIQEDIEAAYGRLQFMDHSSAYSTIEITYYQLINGATEPENNFPQKIKVAFLNGFEIIENVFIVAISAWPLLLVVILAGLGFKRFRLRRGLAIKK